MNRLIILSTTIVITLSSASTNAAVVERDWLAPGDGLLTYDTVSGREWLDLPVTRLSQYTNLSTARDKLDIIDGVANALPLLEPGGPFEEFTLASSDDVFELFSSAGIDQTSIETILQSSEAMFRLLELLERTPFPMNETPPTFYGMFGVVNEIEVANLTTPPFANQAISGVIRYSRTGAILNSIINHQVTAPVYQPFDTGLYLFRQSVPEPGTVTILITSSLSFGLSNLRC